MKKLNIHIIQHIDFEGPGIIADWAIKQGHCMSYTHVYKDESYPNPNLIDLLVIMGGPMSVYETDKYNWIESEKQFIFQCIDKKKSVLGICLGAQLIASTLGSKVYPGPVKEIGWFPVSFHTSYHQIFPKEQIVFHWHGDTFDIPENAKHLCSSEKVPNQGFIYNNHVFALQFHLEVKKESVLALVENCGNDLTDEPFVQQESVILENISEYETNFSIMKSVLSFLCNRIN